MAVLCLASIYVYKINAPTGIEKLLEAHEEQMRGMEEAREGRIREAILTAFPALPEPHPMQLHDSGHGFVGRPNPEWNRSAIAELVSRLSYSSFHTSLYFTSSQVAHNSMLVHEVREEVIKRAAILDCQHLKTVAESIGELDLDSEERGFFLNMLQEEEAQLLAGGRMAWAVEDKIVHSVGRFAIINRDTATAEAVLRAILLRVNRDKKLEPWRIVQVAHLVSQWDAPEATLSLVDLQAAVSATTPTESEIQLDSRDRIRRVLEAQKKVIEDHVPRQTDTLNVMWAGVPRRLLNAFYMPIVKKDMDRAAVAWLQGDPDQIIESEERLRASLAKVDSTAQIASAAWGDVQRSAPSVDIQREAATHLLGSPNTVMYAAGRAALEIRIALMRFRRDRGEEPEHISDLVPDYIQEDRLANKFWRFEVLKIPAGNVPVFDRRGEDEWSLANQAFLQDMGRLARSRDELEAHTALDPSVEADFRPIPDRTAILCILNGISNVVNYGWHRQGNPAPDGPVREVLVWWPPPPTPKEIDEYLRIDSR